MDRIDPSYGYGPSPSGGYFDYSSRQPRIPSGYSVPSGYGPPAAGAYGPPQAGSFGPPPSGSYGAPSPLPPSATQYTTSSVPYGFPNAGPDDNLRPTISYTTYEFIPDPDVNRPPKWRPPPRPGYGGPGARDPRMAAPQQAPKDPRDRADPRGNQVYVIEDRRSIVVPPPPAPPAPLPPMTYPGYYDQQGDPYGYQNYPDPGPPYAYPAYPDDGMSNIPYSDPNTTSGPPKIQPKVATPVYGKPPCVACQPQGVLVKVDKGGRPIAWRRVPASMNNCQTCNCSS